MKLIFSAILTAGMLAALAGCSGSAASAPLPPPGHQSPASAVVGYTTNMVGGRTAAACSYTAPGIRYACYLVLEMFNLAEKKGGPSWKLSGSWSLGASVTSGARAIVDFESRDFCLGPNDCLNNSDPQAGLPHAGLSFNAAYQQALTSRGLGFATDCVLVDGRWYVWPYGS